MKNNGKNEKARKTRKKRKTKHKKQTQKTRQTKIELTTDTRGKHKHKETHTTSIKHGKLGKL